MSARPPVIEAASVMPDETGAGWYLRGDVGYSRNVPPAMSWQSTQYGSKTAGDSATFGVGVGYRFSDNLRADVTLDAITSHRLRGWLNATDSDRLNQDSTVFMANGYYDIAKVWGLTPYIGAGIGIARINSDPLTRDLSGTPSFTFSGTIHYSMAVAATTGFSFDIGHGLQADIGYKFLWIDKTQSGTEKTGTLPDRVNIGDSSSHQIRVGLRYFIN